MPKNSFRVCACVLMVFWPAWAGWTQEIAEVHWPSFRGLQASGLASGKAPLKWAGFKWKTPIPGLGHSSPVIWGERVFVTTAVSAKGEESLKIGLYGDIAPVQDEGEQSWQVFCLDKRKGTVVWKQTAHEGVPRIKRHTKASHANATMAVDEMHVVACFGAEGLFCYDSNGKLRWRKELGILDSGFFMMPLAQWGFGSSLVIHSNVVYLQCDVQTNSFIAALKVSDGSEIWRTPRKDVPTWSTPTVHTRSGRAQVIANGFRHIGGYDLLTGKEIWKLSRAGDIPVPTPIVAHDLIYITSAHGRYSPIYAIRTDASGDLTLGEGEIKSRGIAWSLERGGNYMQTPIVVGGYFYACRDNGVVSCFRAKTGERLFEERLGNGRTGFTASPVSADGKIFYTSEEGTIYVLAAEPVFKVLATNDLGETCLATPALSEELLYFRTRHHLAAVE